MKKINLKKTAKILQNNHKKSVGKLLRSMLGHYEIEDIIRYMSKEDRVEFLNKLMGCKKVSENRPQITIDVSKCYTQKKNIEWLVRHRIPTIDSIYKDLLCLKREFCDINFSKNILSVVTDNIILEDIDFGKFSILLNTNDIPLHEGDIDVFVEALEPIYAPGDTLYTHPHVDYGRLCPGEGEHAITSSLRDFRILDYFSIVNSILHTYSPGNAYQDIYLWGNKYVCGDCSNAGEEDEMHECCQCCSHFCNDCIGYCKKCENCICNLCASSCCRCHSSICENCVSYCIECDEALCSSCGIETDCDCGYACKTCITKCNNCGNTLCSGCTECICEDDED